VSTTINLDKSKELNILCTKGYTFGPLLLQMSVTNSDPKEYYDITQWSFEMKAKVSSFQLEANFQFTDLIKGENGQLLITKSASEMNLIQAMTYLYELRATLPNGESYRIINGKIIVKDAVND
jgi:hypothetical protein